MNEDLIKLRAVVVNIQGENFNAKFPLCIMDLLDELVRDGKFDSRSHAVRVAIKMLLNSEGLLDVLPTIDELDEYTLSRITRSTTDFLSKKDGVDNI